ncbi:putative bifunctional diguanylate cyclase/phosphodiesterase [Cucumibacter marinus]|uniref:putative bifunctional diguanylate cyclase/phosphodiesterase n=1 Tax=Cucumibacter marinus TaxID=1121252 RepID=UPI00041BE384|nr:EAL domain-containing protein [Cucumibacter marinus]
MNSPLIRKARRLLTHRAIAIIAIVLGLVVGSTIGAVKLATDRLLNASATSTAQHWANLLADTVGDLEQIGAGMPPSQASTAFFDWARQAGHVFRYEIYNRQGYSQLISDKIIEQVDISEYSVDAVKSLQSESPVVSVFEGDGTTKPEFFSRAVLPVIEDGEPVAIVAAYVDQTAERQLFRNTFAVVSVFLCLVTGLAFSLPAMAWYRRTREKRVADRRIRFLAHHDALTGLTNRVRLVERLNQMLQRLPDTGTGLAIHFVDLDRFKEINDTYGHSAGDLVLRAVAERLNRASAEGDLVSRLGGDEFIVIQHNVSDMQGAGFYAEHLAEQVGHPIVLPCGQEVASTASVGIAMAPADGTNSERLLKCADLALYAAKAAGKNCARFFEPEMDARLEERIALERRLREAIRTGDFVLHYQPIVALPERRLVGFEALVRLPHEDGSLIPPGVFIPVAEDLQLIDRLGEWVLRNACAAAADWPSHLKVAVNLSPTQFDSGPISEMVSDILDETGLGAARLEIEITEQLLISDTEAVMQELARLKSLGISIAMDDFGIGYSSLSYLWRFPFDRLKIDRSFMQSLDSKGRNTARVIHTIVALGREMDMDVTVEGVETARQLAFLQTVQPDQLQGFYFGRPMPLDEATSMILKDLAAPPSFNQAIAATRAV